MEQPSASETRNSFNDSKKQKTRYNSPLYFERLHADGIYRSNGLFRPPRGAINDRMNANKRSGYRLWLAEVGLIERTDDHETESAIT